MRDTLLTVVTLLIVALGSGAQAGTAEVDRIQALNAQWLAMVGEGDAAGIANLYAPDGRLLPPGAPAATGREAVQAIWEQWVELPSLTFGSHGVQVAEGGDIAYDTGWIEMEVPGEGGAVETLRGKYVVVWEKVGDGWQVAVDILNLD